MHKGGGKPSEELKHFTNREKEKDVFTRYVNVPHGGSLPVLMFYGVGGTGKTWLTKRLRQLLSEPPFVNKPGDVPVPSARLDMDINSGGGRYHQDAASAYAEVRRQFGVECPSFDLAYSMLRYKQGLRDEAEFRHGGAFHHSWECVCEASNAAANSIPGGSFFVWVGKKVSQKVGRELQETALGQHLLSATGNREFFELRSLDVDDLYRLLPQRLGADLDANLPTRKGHACQGVLVLDTLEAALAGVENNAQQYERVRWIASLYENMEHLLILMAGRDRLTWGEVDGDWNNPAYLEQHLVGGLSRHDATTFLGWCGITENHLQHAVLRVCVDVDAQQTSHGDTPYHSYSLALCADAIVQERNRGVESDPQTFDMAPGNYDRLAQRFLKSLANEAEADWIVRLALPFRFDEPAARHAFSPVPNAAQNVAWENLKNYSFVAGPDAEGWHTLHLRMREALRKRLADPNKRGDAQRSHGEWRTYWQSRMENDTDGFAHLAWVHRCALEPEAAHEEWERLIKRARTGGCPDMGLHYRLLRWWQPTNVQTSATQESAAALNSLGVELYYASLGSRSQNLQQAIACYEAALRVRTEADYPSEWAITQNNLGVAYRNLPSGDRGSNLQQAIACYTAALRVRTEADFPSEWAMTQNNLGLAYNDLPTGDRTGNLQRAIQCFEAALRVRTEADFPSDWAMTQNNLGLAYNNLPTGAHTGNQQQAIACYTAALRVYIQTDYPQQWAITQNNLGLAYSDLPTGDRTGNQQRAIQCFEAALRVHTEADFPMYYGDSQVCLGNAYTNLGETERAREHFLLAVQGYVAAGLPPEWEWRAYAERRLREL